MLLNIGWCASYVIKHAGGALCIAPCRYGYRGRRVQIGAYNPCIALNGSSPLLESTKLTLAEDIIFHILLSSLTARFLSACKQSTAFNSLLHHAMLMHINTIGAPATLLSYASYSHRRRYALHRGLHFVSCELRWSLYEQSLNLVTRIGSDGIARIETRQRAVQACHTAFYMYPVEFFP